MAGLLANYGVRGLTTPRPGVLAGRRPRSRLARAFARNSPLRHMDWLLVAVVLGLTAIGTLLVWSATEPGLVATGQDGHTYLKKQLLNVVIGVVLMFGVSLVDTRQLRTWTPFVYAATLLALVAVLTPLGSSVNGARAWFSLPGGFQVEPSEFAKIALILVLAMTFSSRVPARSGPAGAAPGALPGHRAGLCRPADRPGGDRSLALGVALVLVVVTGTMIVLSGLRLRVLRACSPP